MVRFGFELGLAYVVALIGWAVVSPIYDRVLCSVAALVFPLGGFPLDVEAVDYESGAMVARAHSDMLDAAVLAGARLETVHYNAPILVAILLVTIRSFSKRYAVAACAALVANLLFHLAYVFVLVVFQLTVLHPHVMFLPEWWDARCTSVAKVFANSLTHQIVALGIATLFFRYGVRSRHRGRSPSGDGVFQEAAR